ncbi:hypothetical protein [Williamsia sp. 1135]|uniref:hypothetical protein n=1 Tax=Williamsia sp. 1135 TaxID=1889262 RepID=UPI000A0FC6B6|nr:hypothetical protein [Williamsia sp. 1135]ORM36223.1 hypothetical protein BFL43_07790 [Williamsia sp. 1135]
MNRTALAIVLSAIAAIALVLGVIVWLMWPDNDTTGPAAPPQSTHSDDHGSDHDHEIADPLDPQNADINATAEQALRTMFTWQPVSDSSPGDAVLRAQPWLGGELANASGRDTSVRPPADWPAWQRSGDLVSASAVVIASVSTTDTKAVRTVQVDQNVMRPTGDTVAYSSFTARAELTRTDNGWRVTGYTVLPTTN